MAGRRYSRQRELIYCCVKNSCDHPTAEMVYHQLKPHHPNLSMGTVYRNLNLLAEEGALTRMSFSVDRYDAVVKPHSHFRCLCCTRVIDIAQPYDFSLDDAVRKQSDCQITGHTLIFEGLCPDCQKRQPVQS